MGQLDINIVIGGPQGGGIDTSANMIIRAFAYAGMDVFSVREFHSNIKGRHSYVHIRSKDDKVRSLKYPADLLVALDPDTIFEHHEDVSKGTMVIYDSAFEGSDLGQARMIMRDTQKGIKETLEKAGFKTTVKGMLEYMEKKGGKLVPIPFDSVLSSVVSDGPTTRYFNTFGAAVTMSLVGIEKSSMEDAIRYVFGNKESVLKTNLAVVDKAYEYCESNKLVGRKIKKMHKESRIILTGNDGAAIGKIMGGLRFQTYYPITPASDESTIMEEHEDLKWLENEVDQLSRGGVVVVQTEDELSAITMATGAALTGSRSATATSGPGFSLMSEAISFSGMDEVPLVVTLYQRGGPSTGLPTRNGQADLLFAMHAGHGEFPRIVITSGDVEETIYDSMKALNYAQKYQVPVIHLIDKNLANTSEILEGIDTRRVKLEIPEIIPQNDGFKRFSLDTSNGISRMGAFGKNIFWLTGDEHDEIGHVTEDTRMRDLQMEKRFRKLETAEKEIPIEDKVVVFGDKKADVTFVSWGSQKGPIMDAMNELKKIGISSNFLYLKMFIPFPSDFVHDFLSSSKTVIDVESNMTAQAAKVITQNTGLKISNYILKYNGRHVTEDELVEAVNKIYKNGVKKVVLTNGA